jgi:hypothetical protein
MHNQAELTIRPSWKKAMRSVVGRASLAVVFVVGYNFWAASQIGGKGLGIFDIATFVAIAVLALADHLYRISTVIEVTRDQLTIRSIFGRSHAVPRSALGGIALRTLIPRYSMGSAKSLALIFDRHDRTIATLPEAIWTDEDIRRLHAALGLRRGHYVPIAAEDLKHQHPGANRDYWTWIFGSVLLVVIAGGSYLASR